MCMSMRRIHDIYRLCFASVTILYAILLGFLLNCLTIENAR